MKASVDKQTFNMNSSQFDEAFDKGLPILIAFVHQTIVVPGVIGSEKTLSKAKIPTIEMAWAPQGLLAKAKGKRFIVPPANVVVAVLED